MDKCINCNFWQRHSYDPIGNKIGLCENPLMKGNYHNKTPVNGISINGTHMTEENENQIHVGQDFGCVNFEKRGQLR